MMFAQDDDPLRSPLTGNKDHPRWLSVCKRAARSLLGDVRSNVGYGSVDAFVRSAPATPSSNI